MAMAGDRTCRSSAVGCILFVLLHSLDVSTHFHCSLNPFRASFTASTLERIRWTRRSSLLSRLARQTWYQVHISSRKGDYLTTPLSRSKSTTTMRKRQERKRGTFTRQKLIGVRSSSERRTNLMPEMGSLARASRTNLLQRTLRTVRIDLRSQMRSGRMQVALSEPRHGELVSETMSTAAC